MPGAPVAAMVVFGAVFAVATVRTVHLGILMFIAACAAGPLLAGMTLREVLGGFPVAILILVAGVTYLFGIAHANGTTDRLMSGLIARAGARRGALPLVFFGLAAVASAMGSPQAGLVTAPVGMPLARRAGIDPVLMAIAINSGISAGAFAPTSLFGVVTYRVGRDAGIDVNPFTLLLVSSMANLVLLAGAIWLFAPGQPRIDARAGSTLTHEDARPASTSVEPTVLVPYTRIQMVTLTCMAGLVATIVIAALAGVEPDIGVTALGFGALLAIIDPTHGSRAMARIDWSTAFVVGGIVTYIAVLQRLDGVNLLGRAAMRVGSPFIAALLVCAIAALVSAFASTTGVLAALVPMAVPVATSGEVPGWALVTALGVCATVVDASPFSNTGATLVASAAEDDRPRLRTLLARWGMTLILVSPAILVPVLTLISW
jgi:di/tricarboxylate transporter